MTKPNSCISSSLLKSRQNRKRRFRVDIINKILILFK